jgi:hypothetical protein
LTSILIYKRRELRHAQNQEFDGWKRRQKRTAQGVSRTLEKVIAGDGGTH